jgi:hypothetical protein
MSGRRAEELLHKINEDVLIMWLHDIRTPEYRSKLAGLTTAVPEAIRPTGIGARVAMRVLGDRDVLRRHGGRRPRRRPGSART